MKMKFIKTSDEYTANQLKKSGFHFISKDGNFYTFLNNGILNFKLDEKKCYYSNIMTF